MIITMPTPDMSPWQYRERLKLIEKRADKKILRHLLGDYIDFENDPRLPDVAKVLGLSFMALMWRIARLLEDAE